jgi:SHS family lactate transporter-like MFS transporter
MQPGSTPQPAASPIALLRDQRNALVASFLGWTLDAFDFFLVGYALTQIGAEFHVRDKAVALATTLTLAFRPLGAFIFGLLADRYGRRLPLMLDLVFYSLVEVATGFAPDYATFLVLRALFGIGMGGEWGVGASLVMEKVSPRWRGVCSGFLQEGYACGNLLAGICARSILPHYNWRILFFIGGLPALLALFVRFGVKESAVWEQTRHPDWSSLGRGILSHWKLFLGLTVLMVMMHFSSHGTQDMYPTFLKRYWNFDERRAADITVLSAVGAILGGVLVGLFSDCCGRRRAMSLAFAGALLVVPLWAFAPNAALLALGAFLMQFMVQGAWGVIPAHINELSPDSVRGFLPGFAYQCGVLISGSIGLLQAALQEHIPYNVVMAGTAGVIFAVALVVVLLGPERRGVAFGSPSQQS